jgi:alpha-L-arabinofuranosidase
MMMKKKLTYLLVIGFVFLINAKILAQTIVVKVDKPIAEIQPTMYGIFFEDINFAADGGIYAELVKNRSFTFDTPMMGWLQPNSDRHSMNENSGYANIVRAGQGPDSRYIKVEVNNCENYRLINEGFRGMGIKQGASYDLSVNARQNGNGIKSVKFQLIGQDNKVLGETSIMPDSKEWKNHKVSINATATDAKATLHITFDGNGVLDLKRVSLFPQDTWKGRPGGMRKDLVQLLADIDPGFLRFPGGCIVEGRTLDERYQWKKTVGPVEDRELLINRWNREFAHRPTPDYYQSFGLGFFEYFQLAADMGAEPMPILSCGLACQFNTGEIVPMDELGPYIQDALDLIEFANAPVTTRWGKLRADMGHEAPFNLKYIGIGNEQWGPQYIERHLAFEKAIKEKHPEIIIISTTGPFPDGEHFEYQSKKLKELNAEIVDEHYYSSPQWFFDNATRYDNYDRNSYKVFAGEYAAQSVAIASPDNKNNWLCALSEAAFMTGLERNADVVVMTSYAPLMAHVDAWQWTPDMIWFDNLNSYGTPNYYVQKLFAVNRGTHLVPLTYQDKPLTGQDNLYASAVIDRNKKEVIVKIVNSSNQSQQREIVIDGVKRVNPKGTITVLRSDDLEATNSIEKPKNISPVDGTVDAKGNKVTVTLQPQSLSVVKLKL